MSKFHMENVFIMDSYVLDMILYFFWRYLDRKGKIAKNLNFTAFWLCSDFQRYNKLISHGKLVVVFWDAW